jgi:hypothetical protein
MLAAAFLTTWLTVFSEMPCPQILPARQTHRNSGPPSITAAVTRVVGLFHPAWYGNGSCVSVLAICKHCPTYRD